MGCWGCVCVYGGLDNPISKQHVNAPSPNNETGLRGRCGEAGGQLQDNNCICYFPPHNGSKSGGKWCYYPQWKQTMDLLVICGSWHLTPGGRHALIICSCLILQSCAAAHSLPKEEGRKEEERLLHMVKDCAEQLYLQTCFNHELNNRNANPFPDTYSRTTVWLEK